MRFFQAALVGVTALFSLVAAQSSTLQFTSTPNNVQVGNSYTITWNGASNAPVTILLRQGPSTNLKTVATLTSTATGGSYTWVPNLNIAPGSDYALQITQGGDTNYSGQFVIAGGSPALSTYGSSSAASASITTTISALSSAITSLASLNATTTGLPKNGTITSATLTATGSSTGGASSKGSPTGSATGSSTGAPSNAAVPLANPVGLMFGAMAAFAYFQ